jgi:hypothetical protein
MSMCSTDCLVASFTGKARATKGIENKNEIILW